LGTKQFEQILRRILVCIQGTLKIAYFSYVDFDVTQKTCQKTSSIVQVIEFAILNIFEFYRGTDFKSIFILNH